MPRDIWNLLLAAICALGLLCTACSAAEPPETEPPAEPAAIDTAMEERAEAAPLLPGKIAVVTKNSGSNMEERTAAFVQPLIEAYGEEQIVHKIRLDDSMLGHEFITATVEALAEDPEIKALVISQAEFGVSYAIAKLRQLRDDVFVVYYAPQDPAAEIAAYADLALIPDEAAMGPAMVRQAQAMGAQTFVHYSFPRHLAQPLRAQRRDLIRATCAELGITYVEAEAPDPTGVRGTPGAQQFILEDVPRLVEQYGPDTAFFATSCALQVPLITCVVETGAIYPQPCCPSPYHGFPEALGIAAGDSVTPADVISETRRLLAERGMTGRLATWPVGGSAMSSLAGGKYAALRMQGEAPQEGLDLAKLQQLMEDYAGVAVTMRPYEENGVSYENYQLYLLDYLVY